jgi:hypothetical protein
VHFDGKESLLLTPNRAGFYAENLLIYSEQTQKEGVLPLPIGKDHKFAPIALGVSYWRVVFRSTAD